MILGSDFLKKTLGGHPLRFVILGSDFWKKFTGTLLAIIDFGISFFFQKDRWADLDYVNNLKNLNELNGELDTKYSGGFTF